MGERLKIIVCHGLLPTGGVHRLLRHYKWSYGQFSTFIFVFTNFLDFCSNKKTVDVYGMGLFVKGFCSPRGTRGTPL